MDANYIEYIISCWISRHLYELWLMKQQILIAIMSTQFNVRLHLPKIFFWIYYLNCKNSIVTMIPKLLQEFGLFCIQMRISICWKSLVVTENLFRNVKMSCHLFHLHHLGSRRFMKTKDFFLRRRCRIWVFECWNLFYPK